MNGEIKIYRIQNKRTKEFWYCPSGKQYWRRDQDAKNAWWRWEKGYFRQQTDWIITEFKLVEVDKKEEMNDEFYKKKFGLK